MKGKGRKRGRDRKRSPGKEMTRTGLDGKGWEGKGRERRGW